MVDGNPRAGMLADRDAFLANFEDFASRSLLVKVGDEDAELLLGDSLDAFVERLLPTGSRRRPRHGGSRRRRRCTAPATRPIHADIVRCPARSSTRWARATPPSPRSCGTWSSAGCRRRTGSWAETLHEAMIIAAATVRHEGALLRMPHHDAEPAYPS